MGGLLNVEIERDFPSSPRKVVSIIIRKVGWVVVWGDEAGYDAKALTNASL